MIDVRRIPELGRLEVAADGTLVIGAGVTLTRLLRDARVRAGWPVLAHAASEISTPLLQNMGTVGGNLLLDTRCNYYDQGYEWRKAIDFCMKKDGDICWVAPSSPRCWAVQSSDLAPVMVALDARVVLAGPDGERTIPAAALYHDDGMAFLTKRPEELLVRVEVPALAGARASYRKLRRRGAFDFPVLGVAAWAAFDGAGRVTCGADRAGRGRLASQAGAGCGRRARSAARSTTTSSTRRRDWPASWPSRSTTPISRSAGGRTWRRCSCAARWRRSGRPRT